jgi:hypothetical protein
MIPASFLTILSVLTVSAAQSALAVQARIQKDPVPKELAAAVAALLAPEGVHAETGKAALDFWFVKSLAVKGDAAASWSAVEEGTLVGAVRVAASHPDIRGKTIKPGVYTLRYGIQPSNGDHLGVSPFREFLLLSPAALDTDPAPKGHEGTIELSKAAIGGSHPAVLSIDPPIAGPKDAALGTHTTELGHTSVIVEVPVSRGSGAAGALRFGIVIVGRIEA